MTKSASPSIPHRGKRLPKAPNGNVQLLLIQSVEHLGSQGDVVAVRPGFARNYLIPQGLATIATEHHKRMIEKHRARLEEIQRVRMAGLRSQADELAKQSITIEANANDEGHLYGSVGPHEIAAALKGAAVHVTADMVRLQGPLKELGLYTVKIHLGQSVDADLKVWVVPSVSDADPVPAKKAEAAAPKKAEPAKK
ncbi:MAG: 50S ribosomal protein L9 [Pirellulales bacterium]